MTRAQAYSRAAELQTTADAEVSVFPFYLGNNVWVVRSRKNVGGVYRPSELVEGP